MNQLEEVRRLHEFNISNSNTSVNSSHSLNSKIKIKLKSKLLTFPYTLCPMPCNNETTTQAANWIQNYPAK